MFVLDLLFIMMWDSTVHTCCHGDVMTWKHLSHSLPFMQGSTNHWWIPNIKDQYCWALVFSVLFAWTSWTGSEIVSESRRHDHVKSLTLKRRNSIATNTLDKPSLHKPLMWCHCSGISWLVYWYIYLSLGLNELRTSIHLGFSCRKLVPSLLVDQALRQMRLLGLLMDPRKRSVLKAWCIE